MTWINVPEADLTADDPERSAASRRRSLRQLAAGTASLIVLAAVVGGATVAHVGVHHAAVAVTVPKVPSAGASADPSGDPAAQPINVPSLPLPTALPTAPVSVTVGGQITVTLPRLPLPPIPTLRPLPLPTPAPTQSASPTSSAPCPEPSGAQPPNRMHEARDDNALVTLKDGRVLVIGGQSDDCGLTPYTELYDPATGLWSETGRLPMGRAFNFHALLLPDGRVLIVGGWQQQAELYDPATGTWYAAGSLSQQAGEQAVALLRDGRVLVAGGVTNGQPQYSSSVEIWNPGTLSFSAAAPMHVARALATATLLPDGTVLVVGGQCAQGGLASTEIYDPVHDTWTDGPPIPAARYWHTAVLLTGTDKVLVTEGVDDNAVVKDTEVYDTATRTWQTVGDLNQPRSDFTATALPDGRLMVAGGYAGSAVASTEIYDPSTERWTLGPTMQSVRYQHAATLLANGNVLVAGGAGVTPGEGGYGPIALTEVVSAG